MKIEKIYSFYNVQPKKQSVNFCAASDITIEYALKKHSKYLPSSMIKKIKELIHLGQGKRLLCDVHDEVYKALFEAKTLKEAKEKYSEFADIKDVTTLADNRSKAIKAILKIMPLKDFTLQYIKKLFQPISQEGLVKEYKFTNRNLLIWLNEKLNIKKLSGSYIKLLKMSNEEENSRISELSRRAIYADEKAQKYRLEKAAEAHRTPEYRAKKRREMKEYYMKNPQAAERTAKISRLTWDRCPEIKAAFSSYTKKLSPYIKKILSKKQTGAHLSEEEKRIASAYYKNFWNENPEFKKLYQQRRIEVIEELKNTNQF